MMPKAVEDKLRKEALARRLKGKAADRYVYGTMNKRGLMPKKPKQDNESAETKPDSEKAEGELSSSSLMAVARAHMQQNKGK